jgi:hypothetical protein
MSNLAHCSRQKEAVAKDNRKNAFIFNLSCLSEVYLHVLMTGYRAGRKNKDVVKHGILQLMYLLYPA